MKAPEQRARRVLVVDDEPAVCDSVRRMLVSDQYEVETAMSGEEALAAVQRSKFDLVILDYEMPGMKGDKLASAIKALTPQQPIMMMTAYGESLRYGGNFPLPVDRVMPKPFELKEFREAVRELVGKD